MSPSRTAINPEIRNFASVFAVALGILSIEPAHADPGIPMLAIVWPFAWLFLVFVIPLEAFIAKRLLHVDYGKSLKIAAKANLYSTLLGIPLAWIVMLLAEIMVVLAGSHMRFPLKGPESLAYKLTAVTIGSAWLPAPLTELDEASRSWMLIAAWIFLCIPFFFIAVWSEYLIVRSSFDKELWSSVRRWAWQANAASYGLIVLVLSGLLIIQALTDSSSKLKRPLVGQSSALALLVNR